MSKNVGLLRSGLTSSHGCGTLEFHPCILSVRQEYDANLSSWRLTALYTCKVVALHLWRIDLSQTLNTPTMCSNSNTVFSELSVYIFCDLIMMALKACCRRNAAECGHPVIDSCEVTMTSWQVLVMRRWRGLGAPYVSNVKLLK